MRLALRAGTPAAAVAAAAAGMSPDPDRLLTGLARALAARGSQPALAMALTGCALLFARWAEPRLAAGRWIEHLPLGHRTLRRSAWCALGFMQAPLVVVLLALAAWGALAGVGCCWPRLAGLPVLALAVAPAVLPSRSRWALAPLGLGASFLSVLGTWPALFAAAALLALTDRIARPPDRHARRAGSWHARAGLPVRIALRATGPRIVPAFLTGCLPLAAGALFLRNNALEPWAEAGAARCAGGFSVVLFVATLAETLAVRRPPWPWARSLPWSSRRRAGSDAAILAVAAMPLALATACLDSMASLAVLAELPLLACCAATGIRRAPELRSGAAGAVFLQGAIVALSITLIPWLGILALAAAPVALGLAARSERDVRTTRWLPLHHRSAGDPRFGTDL